MRALAFFGVIAVAFASKCQDERAVAQSSGQMGTFAPQCNDDGTYHHTQCRESRCFCVDPDGGHTGVEGSVAERGTLERTCASKCLQERQKSTLLGAFKPACEDDGSYHHTQCTGSICYCADVNGRRMPGTEGPIHEKGNVEARCGSRCNQERRQPTLLGAYKPICSADGRYHHTQCVGSVCFCADVQSGVKRAGTETPIAERVTLEKACRAKCLQEEYAAKRSSLIGAHSPQCEDSGRYYPLQCRESTCYCVDRVTGSKIRGTERDVTERSEAEKICLGSNFGLNVVNLEALSACEQERNDPTKAGLLGAFRPQCAPDGKYHHTQCHGSICYCVDTENGVKREGTETPIAEKADLESSCKARCFQEQYIAKKSGHLGSFSPKCEQNGRYYPLQCREASCFCVDRVLGQKLDGTETPIAKRDEAEKLCQGSNDFNLDAESVKVDKPKTKCEAERDDPSKTSLMGSYRPACESESGAYKVVQCRESVCFCADPVTGQPLEGSQRDVSQHDAMEGDCMNGMSRCQKERYNAAQRRGMRGAFIPKCTQNGLYERAQCHESLCHCVDEVDGSKVVGTEGSVGAHDVIVASCEMPACQAQRAHAKVPGAYKPQCSPHGYFKPVQCHGSMCFCVDRVSGEKTGVEAHISNISYLHAQCMTDCEKKRDLKTSQIAGSHGPTCNIDGSYHNVQCVESVCGCAMQGGNVIPATEKNVAFKRQLDRQCPGGPTTCQKLRIAFRWSTCPAECTYYKGYGEALVYCCCD